MIKKNGWFWMLAFLAAAVFMPFAAFAQAAGAESGPEPGQRHLALQNLAEQGYGVEFLGHAYGVDGWMIYNEEAQAQYAYTTPEGGFIAGLLFGPDGDIHTARQLEQFRDVVQEGSQAAMVFGEVIEESNAPRSERIYAEVAQAKYFTLGDTETPYIYSFINPTCVHCLRFWNEQMRGLVDAGVLHLRMIPFGSETVNREAAAVLLTAPDAEDIWRRYADGAKDAFEAAGVEAPQGIYDAVEANTGLFRALGLRDVPFSIYRATADGQIKVIAGVPQNAMMISADFVR